jgi:protein phosphatase
VGAVAYEPGDVFLLCTDGLIEGLHDSNLEEFLRSPGSTRTGAHPARRLVEESVVRSGRDNTTAIVIRVL